MEAIQEEEKEESVAMEEVKLTDTESSASDADSDEAERLLGSEGQYAGDTLHVLYARPDYIEASNTAF